MRKQSNAEVFRITGARQGLEEDIRGRQRRYVLSMSIRTVAVLLAVILWNVERPVAIAALVLGAVLPYVAVVIANAGRENTPPLPSTFIPPPVRPELKEQDADDREKGASDRPDDEATATEGEHQASGRG